MLVQPIKLLSPDNNTWSILLGIAFIILAIIFITFLMCHRTEIELASIFLSYANEFLKQNWILFFYVPLSCLFSLGLIVLVVWQYISFSSINKPTWKDSDVYMTIHQQVFLQVLNFIEFVWGIQFIRDSCNLSFIQLTTSFQEMQSNGTSFTIKTKKSNAQDQSTDYSAKTGEVQQLDLSSMLFSIFSASSSTSLE